MEPHISSPWVSVLLDVTTGMNSVKYSIGEAISSGSSVALIRVDHAHDGVVRGEGLSPGRSALLLLLTICSGLLLAHL